jgi:phospholipid transport system substrate-binding protein
MSPHLPTIAATRVRGTGRVGRLVVSSLLVLVWIAPGALPARAQAPEPARQVIERTVDKAFAILRDPGLKNDPRQRMSKLRAAVDPAFDWEAMARSSLGVPWRQLDEQQRSEFVSTFKELLAQRYMDDIDRFQGSEQVKIKSSDERDGSATVRTVLITTSRDQIPIDYTLHQAGGRWEVVDVTIEGISLVNHYRKTFARYLVNKSFTDLMQQLKRKLGPPPSAVP